jgi:hypothetical protein
VHLIIAGDDYQAEVCARIKGFERGEWQRITGENDVRARDLRGKTVYLFGTYRQRHMFVIRELLYIIQARGGRTEEVVDGRC